jgi:molybdopterin/thiamine biosynthesis adenylyltransferase
MARVSNIRWDPECYEQATGSFEAEKPDESFLVAFVKEKEDPFKKGHVIYDVKRVLIAEEDDYQIRNSTYFKMKRSFHDKVGAVAKETGLLPRVFHHCQPIDVLSSTDVKTGKKVEDYYGPGTLTGSYNHTHRFFQLNGNRFDLVPWDVADGKTARHELAFGEDIQRLLLSSSVIVAGAGGIAWKMAVDLALLGIGRIGIVDPDVLDISNLGRIAVDQVEVGSMKAEVLQAYLERLRPNLICDSWCLKVQKVPESIFKNYDVMIVATDNFNSRIYCNRISIKLKMPSIQIAAKVSENEKLISCRSLIPGETRCFECGKTFGTKDLDHDFRTEEETKRLAKNYGSRKPVPSIVSLNSMAAGIAVDMLIRVIVQKDIAPYVYLNLHTLELQEFFEDRDPDCLACSNIAQPDSKFSGRETE